MRREHDIRVRVTEDEYENIKLLKEVRKQWIKAEKQGRK